MDPIPTKERPKRVATWCRHRWQGTFFAIVTVYEERLPLISQHATQQVVALHTVDSVQGQQVHFVILMITRTSTSKFLDDKLRIDVAITTCPHGQFVLKRMGALELPYWGRSLRWVNDRDVIVSTTTFPDLFEKDELASFSDHFF